MKPDAKTLLFLIMPPLMWAGNAVVGRLLVAAHIPPVLMNAVRWALVAVLLAPWAWHVLKDGNALRARWRYLAVVGALGVGTYNALQYLALQTSSPLNVTLIGSSMPLWMMLVGVVGFGQRVTPRQVAGAVLSCAGVVLVLSRGDWAVLREVRLVPGDLLMLLAALAWSVYSWLLVRPSPSMAQGPRWSWLEFLWMQVLFGLGFALLCSGAEQAVRPADTSVAAGEGWRIAAGLAYIALGPSILAYWGWGQGVKAVGPTVAAFFSNLTPVFAAGWAWVLLGTTPSWYHPVALALITSGIVVSSSKPAAPARAA